MYVTASLTIELDANASFSDMEHQIQQAGREAMKAALQQALRQSEETEPPCPKCGSERAHTQGRKRRVLLTRLRRVDVPLRRLRCQACHHLFRRAASCLAAIQGHNITPGLGELAALVGSSWPYAPAARVLNQLSGVSLSREWLRHLTNEQGRLLAQQQQRQAQDVWQGAVSMEQIRPEREQSHLQGQQTQPHWVAVGFDGGWVRSREQTGGMEGKMGVVASQVEAVGKHGRHRLTKRRYVATFGTAEEVG